MTRLGLSLVVALAATVAVPPAPAVAQGPPPARAEERTDLRPGEIQRLFDAYVVMEAQQALGLTDRQFAPLLPRLRALQETRRRHLAARVAVLADLARMTNRRGAVATDDATLRGQLAALQELDSRGAAELRRAYAELDGLLDVRQQARFRVFEDQLERRKLELMLRARQSARQQRLEQRRRQ